MDSKLNEKLNHLAKSHKQYIWLRCHDPQETWRAEQSYKAGFRKAVQLLTEPKEKPKSKPIIEPRHFSKEELERNPTDTIQLPPQKTKNQ